MKLPQNRPGERRAGQRSVSQRAPLIAGAALPWNILTKGLAYWYSERGTS